MPPSRTIPQPGQRIIAHRLDKQQIEQRIEEDRERHKRLRENIWAISQEDEITKLWEETSELGDDDHTLGEEELANRQECIQPCRRHEAAGNVTANGKSAT